MNILVISGFLGAGKTTFVLRLARELVEVRGEKVAIIENEAGKIGVDDAKLRQAGLDVREVFGGCVCCSMGANLMMTLAEIERDVQPGVVIVEPSGVASPGGMKQLLMSTSKGVRDVRMAVLFDAERFKAFHRVAGPFIEDSLRTADVAVVNKVDLVTGQEAMDLVDRLVQMSGGKAVVAMSGKDGRGVEEVVRELIGEAKSVMFKPAEPGAALTDSVRLGVGNQHSHAGEPGVWASQWEERYDTMRAVASVAAEAAVMIERIAKAIDATDGAVVGHVKAKVATDGGDVFISATSGARAAEISGVTQGMTRGARMTLNVLAYQMSAGELERVAGEYWPNGGG